MHSYRTRPGLNNFKVASVININLYTFIVQVIKNGVVYDIKSLLDIKNCHINSAFLS